MEKGLKITICSGRTPAMQRTYISQLGFKGPYVACNGALLVDGGNDGLQVYGRPIDSKTLEDLCAFALKEEIHICLQTKEALYFSKNNPRIKLVQKYNYVAKKYESSPAPVRSLDITLDTGGLPVYKALVYAPEKQKFEKIMSYLNENSEISYTFSENYLFDIMYKGINKGEGIKRVAGYYGIPIQEVCAFGDYDNDMPMFSAVGTSVAMGNATSKLKSVSTFITDTNNNDGVGKGIEVIMKYFGL